MHKILTIFVNDVKHLFSNIVTTIICLGLILLPSFFTWYNIMACWNVFDNTGNLKVAVASSDEGYESDLFPLEVNIGETVISELRANDQIDWVFVTTDEAIEGVSSGAYYAAVVIPESFSKDMLTFYSDESEHAKLIYYSNEKINAISPRITSTGASTVSYQVNEVFAETLSKISLTVAQSLSNYLDNSDASGRIASLSNNIRTLANRLDQGSSALGMYATLASSSAALINESAQMIESGSENAKKSIEEAKAAVSQAESSVGDLSSATAAFSAALGSSASSLDDLINITETTPSITQEDIDNSVQQLTTQKESVDAQIATYQALLDAEKAKEDPDEQLIAQYEQTIESLTQLSTNLGNSIALLQGEGVTDEDREKIKTQAKEAQDSIYALQATFEQNVQPDLDVLAEDVSALASTVENAASKLSVVDLDLANSVYDAGNSMSNGASAISSSAAKMGVMASDMRALADNIDNALANEDSEALKNILGSDSADMASMLATPVNLERNAVFATENFGSAMAPLYTTIALFVGCLLIMVLVKPKVSGRCLEDLPEDDYKPRHFFLGRGLTVFLMAFVQGTIMCLGNIFFLGVQCENPLLYLLSFWAADFLFITMSYTLVLSFVNLGKAIMVIFLIIQVTACGGSYPLQILPDFVQFLSPLLPATHVVNAMRAAMMGVYMGDFWIEIAILLLMSIPFWALGFFLRKPFERFMDWYLKKVDESKIVI